MEINDSVNTLVVLRSICFTPTYPKNVAMHLKQRTQEFKESCESEKERPIFPESIANYRLCRLKFARTLQELP